MLNSIAPGSAGIAASVACPGYSPYICPIKFSSAAMRFSLPLRNSPNRGGRCRANACRAGFDCSCSFLQIFGPRILQLWAFGRILEAYPCQGEVRHLLTWKIRDRCHVASRVVGPSASSAMSLWCSICCPILKYVAEIWEGQISDECSKRLERVYNTFFVKQF